MAILPGNRVGPYEILSAIGSGGMGEVYRARDTRLERTVAVKVLLEVFINDHERLARFKSEGRVLAVLLSHIPQQCADLLVGQTHGSRPIVSVWRL